MATKRSESQHDDAEARTEEVVEQSDARKRFMAGEITWREYWEAEQARK